jgi:tetratricopeptide (TPR) repeat protein
LHQLSDDQVAGILLEKKLAKKKDVYYARIYQLRHIAISTFSLRQGNWIFTAGEPDPPLRETFEIPLDGILVEGARAVDHVSLYAGRWQYDVPVLFNEIPMASEIYFTDAEREFYAAVQRQGKCSCQELIARLNIIPLEFWRSILTFHLMGIVEFEKGEVPLNVSADIASLLELNQRMQLNAVDGPGLLGLSTLASAAAVEKAKGEFLARFAPERFGSAAAPEIKNIARAVCRRLQAVAAKPPTPALRLEAVEESPIEMEWFVELEPPAEPEKSEEVFELSAEFAIESEPLPEPLPQFAPVAAPPSLRVTDTDHEKSWDLLLQSKELYEKHKYSNAVPLLKMAIKLQPGQGDFYYLLGLCQSKMELMENEAEMNLKKAVEFKSWSADPVYALGVLYRGQGKMKLAERCFQRVKEISYEHTGAGRHLVDLRRLRSGGKNKFPFGKK